MSRPEKPINWTLVDNLCEAGCDGTQIAPHFDIHPNTFYRRVEEKFGVSFSVYSQEKNKKGEANIKAVQYAKALGHTKKGDNQLLIFLGKTRLKQVEAPVELTFDEKTLTQFNAIMDQLTEFQRKKN